MYKIINNLYVGPLSVLPFARECKFSILGCCKYPLHQQNARLKGATKDGYLRINKDEPEYYFAEREHALYCNLVDAKDMEHIPDIIIERALRFIADEILQGGVVVSVCNSGISRSPSIAMMYLIREGYFDDCDTFEESVKRFKSKYPMYSPNRGMYDYTKNFFYKEIGGHKNG